MTTLLFSLGVLLLFMSSLFVIALVRGDNGTADIGYGVAFMVVVSTALILKGVAGWTILIAFLPFVWGTRLAYRIYRKNRGKPEDFRYRAWREAWGNMFVIRSFFQIYMLQGFVVFLVALPVLLAIVFPSEPVTGVVLAGFLVWCIGFFFEARGDYELDRFLANPENKGKIMTEGLWRFTRHPNYFGESTMWWGLALMCFGLSHLSTWGLVSPLLITYLLLYVSGVPMLEKRWEGNPDWEAYKKRTSVFFPLPPRSL